MAKTRNQKQKRASLTARGPHRRPRPADLRKKKTAAANKKRIRAAEHGKDADTRHGKTGEAAASAQRQAETRPSGRVFLLSPANCNGPRAKIVLSERATFDLAMRLRSEAGVALGEVFAFVSGLYFKGKLMYALNFARPPEPGAPIAGSGVLVITPNAGLRPAETRVTDSALRSFAGVDIAANDPRYRGPLLASARALAEEIGLECEVVLLGSIASAKYVDVLTEVFGPRLLFPIDFVGRGDMSRGGLLLRAARGNEELTYAPVVGAVRHGPRPPKLAPIPGIMTVLK